jgi:hypothetical protein
VARILPQTVRFARSLYEKLLAIPVDAAPSQPRLRRPPALMSMIAPGLKTFFARPLPLKPARRDWILAALQRDVPALAVVEMIPEITVDARALLMRHPLRAGDAIQLASCLYLQRQLAQPVPFVAFDRRLVGAAHAEGLTVITTASNRQAAPSPARSCHPIAPGHRSPQCLGD